MATPKEWSEVDDYFADLLFHDDPALDAALGTSAEAGLPPHHVAPNQGKLLYLLARIQGARRILEIGTLGGYSAIWLARAHPPGGRLITLEANSRHTEVARANIARAGLAEVVDVREGSALESLARIGEQSEEPFDFIFIDADKANNPHYLEWALQLSRPGSLIVADNVVRGGAVVDGASTDPDVRGIRRFMELLALEPRVSATVVQTVGDKGYDGLALALVTGS